MKYFQPLFLYPLLSIGSAFKPEHGHYNNADKTIDVCPAGSHGIECKVQSFEIIYLFWPAGEKPGELFWETCLPWPSKYKLQQSYSQSVTNEQVTPNLQKRLRLFGPSYVTQIRIPVLQNGFQTLWIQGRTRRIPTIIQCVEKQNLQKDQVGITGDPDNMVCMWAK